MIEKDNNSKLINDLKENDEKLKALKENLESTQQ
jgi:hypothetical protein